MTGGEDGGVVLFMFDLQVYIWGVVMRWQDGRGCDGGFCRVFS